MDIYTLVQSSSSRGYHWNHLCHDVEITFSHNFLARVKRSGGPNEILLTNYMRICTKCDTTTSTKDTCPYAYLSFSHEWANLDLRIWFHPH